MLHVPLWIDDTLTGNGPTIYEAYPEFIRRRMSEIRLLMGGETPY
jgi:hypothetical protein